MITNRKKGDTWTKEEMISEAKKYSSRTELKNNNRHVYDSLKKIGLLDSLLPHRQPKWTKEDIISQAKKYSSRNSFKKGNKNAYQNAMRQKILDEVCSHMTPPKIGKFWTKEEIIEIANKYTNYTKFRSENPNALESAKGKGILKEICSHMNYKPPIRWTEKMLIDIANKYTTKADFRLYDYNAYTSAREKKILDRICSHMKPFVVPWNIESVTNEAKRYSTKDEFKTHSPNAFNYAKKKGLLKVFYPQPPKIIIHYSLEELQKEALKYNSRESFWNESKKMYNYAKKENLLNQICEHMIYYGISYERYIYSFEFPSSNYVYVGLTCSLNRRYQEHLITENSSVYQHIKNTNEEFIFKVLTLDPLNIDEAPKMEQTFLEKYKSDGWNILNKVAAGSTGGMPKKWTEECLYNIALKYSNRKDFAKYDNKAYNTAMNKKLLNKLCMHMIPITRTPKLPYQKKLNYYYQIHGVKYNSVREASEALKIKHSIILKQLKDSKFQEYIIVDLNGNLKTNSNVKRRTIKRKYHFIIDNIRYESLDEIIKAKNISTNEIQKKIASVKYPNYQRVKN